MLRTRDKLLIFAFFGGFLLVMVGLQWCHNARYHAVPEGRHRLAAGTSKQAKALEVEHKRRYAQLKQPAEEKREKWEARRAAEGEASSATAALLAETNALREDLWTEELRYYRAVSALMNPEDAKGYLAPVEKRFAERKPDANGLLNIPHN